MLKVLDLFSGVGAMSYGLEKTGGFETVAFCEIAAFQRRILAKHWPKVHCYEDVRTVTAERIAADGIAVDVIAGGFPCQDISLNGGGAGLAGSRSGLFHHIPRLVGELGPRVVVLENVSAIVDRGLGDVLGALAEVGYDAWWDCSRAANVGAPQLRDRFWCVAYPSGSEEGQQIARNCHRVFEEARAHQASPAGRGPGVLGGRNWDPEPGIRRVVDGIATNVDRVAALGNSIVPQVPELIGRAILAAMEEERVAA